jgi:hypothetical protein
MKKAKSPNPSTADLQARLDKRADEDYQKVLRDPLAQERLANLNRNALKSEPAKK